jgi:hypothetical protein
LRIYPSQKLPAVSCSQNLIAGWDNEGFVADLDYADELARRATTTTGPILECGTGMTTIILGLLAGRRGVEIWSLENSSDWHHKISGTLKHYEIKAVRICLAPLRDYGGYSWYDPSLLELPKKFSLVVCDLIPVMQAFIKSGTIILLDDADRSGEAEVIRSWQKMLTLDVALHDQTRGQFAVIRVV